MEYIDVVHFILYVLSAVFHVLSHPQCLDYRPPFQVDGGLEFCTEYTSFGCCTKEKDQHISTEYYRIIQEVKLDLIDLSCYDNIKSVLCQECSPYAAHIYDAEATQTIKPFPGLCEKECRDFYSRCRAAVPLITNDATTQRSLSSVDEFCGGLNLTDIDYCYPDLKTNPALNYNISNEVRNEEGCLCVEEIDSLLMNPLAMRSPKDGSGRIFVAEQAGYIHILYRNRTRNPYPFLDMSHLVLTSAWEGDERGFLGFAFHPSFNDNGRLYIYFSIMHNDTMKVRISEIRVHYNNKELVDNNSERVLLEVVQPYWNHNGGEILFGTDGYLYAFLGDGGGAGDPHNYSQNKGELLGSAIRIDVDSPPDDGLPYKIPSDNPFVNEPEARPEIYAYGVRNIWRCDVDEGDPETGHGHGRIICGDVGQNAFEEIDIIEKGGNYGWNSREGFECFNEDTCGKIGPEVLPIFAYPHSEGKSVTGGHVYRGCMNPNLRGYYIYGDFVRGRLFRLKENITSGEWENKEIFMCGPDICLNGLESTYVPNILSFGEDEEGEMYMLSTSYASSASASGKVYRLVDPRRRGDPAKCNSVKQVDAKYEVTTKTDEQQDQEEEDNTISSGSHPGIPVTTCVMIPVLTCITYYT